MVSASESPDSESEDVEDASGDVESEQTSVEAVEVAADRENSETVDEFPVETNCSASHESDGQDSGDARCLGSVGSKEVSAEVELRK